MISNSKVYNVFIHDDTVNSTYLYQSICTLEAAIVAADKAIKSKDLTTEIVQIVEQGSGHVALTFSKDNPPDPNCELFTLTVIDLNQMDMIDKGWFTSRGDLYKTAARYPYQMRHDYLIQLWKGDLKEYMETL